MSLITRIGKFPGLRSSMPELFDTDNMFDFPFFKGNWQPAVNIRDNEKNYEIEFAVPGLTKKDFNISVDNGILTVSHTKEEEKKEEKDNYSHREFSYRSFSRSFTLPETVNEEKINAKYKEGVLIIDLPKKDTAVLRQKSKKVQVA